MGKISYYLDFLKEPVRAQAIENAKRFGNYEQMCPSVRIPKEWMTGINAPLDQQTIYFIWRSVLGAFEFSGSLEGSDYWWRILDNIGKYIDADKLPKP